MGSRAFTLLELLIALAMLAVMASLALPALWGRMEGAKLSSAARQIEAAVVSARASAQREGRALALMAVQGDDRLRLRLDVMQPTAAVSGTDAQDVPDGLPQRRNIGMLPARVMVAPQASSAIESDETSAGGMAAFAAPIDADTDESVRLGVALPDGTLLAPAELRVWVRRAAEPTEVPEAPMAGEEPQRNARPVLLIRINRWTGVCTIRPAPASVPDAGDTAAEPAAPLETDGGAE